jgi:protein-S-isoprenylcysteine O-methyltransferase Ste14
LLEVTVIIVVTLALAFVSRASLLKPASHGFYRFLAWECMLGLFALNMRFWYAGTNPTYKFISGFLFVNSLVLILISFKLLELTGKPNPRRNDAPMFEFEKTTVLVTSGIYRYIRHPMYASLLFLCWGFFFKQPSLIGGVLAVTASGLLVAAARVEETENIRYFGDDYRKYMKQTKMFVPYIV